MKKSWNKIDKILAGEIDPAYKKRAGLILKNTEGKKILEIGCGRGFYLKSFRKLFPEAEIVGVDKNKKYLAQIRVKGIKLIEADAQKLPLADNYFENVVASEILEHVDDDKKVLEEIWRVLKNGGKTMITVPNANYPLLWDPLNWFLKKCFNTHISSKVWWLAGIWADHRRLYTKKKIEDKIKKTGFKIEKSWSATHYCLPFSHFMFYAIGKNLVEKGLFKSMNRFENQKESRLRNFLLWPIKIVDGFNEGKNFKTSVNLIYKVRK